MGTKKYTELLKTAMNKYELYKKTNYNNYRFVKVS